MPKQPQGSRADRRLALPQMTPLPEEVSEDERGVERKEEGGIQPLGMNP